jgi:hypothetical protein
MLRYLSIAMAAALSAGGAHAALPEGIAGPWYNPAQSGHGLSITLADRATRGVVLWHVFDPDGAPLTLYIDAVVEGRDLVGPAYAPRGMRFGEFDPADIDLPEWGRVRISFDDCERATLSWEANDPAYADGSLPIERLARIATLDCALPPRNDIPVGLRLLSHDAGSVGGYNAGLGIVDGEGRLWGISASRGENTLRLAEIPGQTFVSSLQPQIYLGTPQRVLDDGSVAVTLSALAPNWAWSRGMRSQVEGTWEPGGGGVGQFPALDERAAGGVNWSPAPESLARLVVPIDASLLAGRYRFPLRGQFFEFTNDLRIDADGNAELADFVGHVSASEGEQGLVDFLLRSRNNPWLRPYVGRGWIDDSALGRRLVLIGDNGSNGFALVATREETAR